jgi:hypothetical protein
MRTWSGLAGLREVADWLRPRLRTLRDDNGRELFDVPRPCSPIRTRRLHRGSCRPTTTSFFLTTTEAGSSAKTTGDGSRPGSYEGNFGTVLIDGFARARWEIVRQRPTATLLITPLKSLTNRDGAAVTDEGVRLLPFAAADAEKHDVRLASADR